MAPNPTAAPILFDRALLRARQDRARRLEPATFLLDRVAEDMEERLAAVTREFSDAAEIWTPGELLRKPVADRFKSITRIEPDETETLPLRRNRSILRSPRSPFSSSTICPACWRRSGARCGRMGCCWRR